MKQTTQTLYDKPWKHAIAAVIGFALAYGAASWSIDSGNLLVYLLTLVLLVFAIKHSVQIIMRGNAK